MTNLSEQAEVSQSLSIFSELERYEYEQLIFCSDPKVGLRAIIAIHNTTLGPALGGTRMWVYPTEQDAIADALRLARGMTYKAAVSRLNLGGGKAVLIGNPERDKSEALFRTYGRFVEGLAGRYITAEDVGTNVRDMEWVRMETKYVTGISRALGGSGDPSPVTALGVYMGMKAACKARYGNDSLNRKKVAMQGAGHVAYHLCSYLRSEGAIVYVTDIYEEKARRIVNDFGAIYVKPEEIYDQEAHIFCPAALGGVLNSDTIPRLKVDIVAGPSNNQLRDEAVHEHMLIERDILYVPDFVINAGGLINVANELEGYNKERALSQAREIYDVVGDVLRLAKQQDLTPNSAAIHLAEERLRKIGQIRSIYAGESNYAGRLGEMHSRR